MEMILALACDQAVVRDDGKLDVQGVFNELFAPGFPAVQDNITVVFVFEWGRDEAGSHPLRADLIDAGGQMILTIQGHTEVDRRSADQPPPQTRLILNLEEVVFPAAGSYRFRVKAGSHMVEVLPLHVVERKSDPGGLVRV